jgi:hypothetical protein
MCLKLYGTSACGKKIQAFPADDSSATAFGSGLSVLFQHTYFVSKLCQCTRRIATYNASANDNDIKFILIGI